MVYVLHFKSFTIMMQNHKCSWEETSKSLLVVVSSRMLELELSN